MDQFLNMAVAEQFDGNATVDQAVAKLGLKSQYDLIPGMAVPLMPHQSIGVAWMLEKEASKLKGGALSDEMGLGKVCGITYALTTSDLRRRLFRCEFYPASLKCGFSNTLQG
jgi:SNF2 family DNA or RNA helicase